MNGALIAEEGWGYPHVVADFRPFDLDYIRALIHQQHRAVGPERFEVNPRP